MATQQVKKTERQKTETTRRDFIKAAAGTAIAAAATGCSTKSPQPQPSPTATPAERQKIKRTSIPSTFARAAFPLGGIGTGTVSLGARGELRDWELVNPPAKGCRPEKKGGGS